MILGRKYSPKEFMMMAWARRGLLTALPMVGLFVALIMSSRIPDFYRSDVLIQIVPQRVPESFVRSTVTVRTADRIQALSQQIMSRTQLERIVQEFDLYPELRARLPMEDVVEEMRSNIKFDVGTGQGEQRTAQVEAFHINFTYRDPKLTARVAEHIGSMVVDQNAQDRGALAEATNQFLEAQLAQARQKLELNEQKLQEFRTRNAGRLPSQLDFNMQAIQNSQLQLQALVDSVARDRERRLMLLRMYNDEKESPSGTGSVGSAAASAPTPQPRDGATETMPMQQQLGAARTGLARLLLRLRPEHPDVVRARRIIADLEQKVAAEGEARDAAAEVGQPIVAPEELKRREHVRQMLEEINGLDRQIAFREADGQRLSGRIADIQGRIEAIPGIESEWVSLTRDYDTQAAAYRDLLGKSEASKVSADLERRQIGEQFRVLDPARLPVKPVPSRRPVNNVTGFALGLFVAVALAALLEIRDSSFRTEADVCEMLALPVMALVPLVESVANRKARRRRFMYSSIAATGAIATGGYVFWAMKLWKFVV